MAFATLRAGFVAAVVGLAWCSASLVRAADEGTVTGTGVVILKRQPELLRMQVELSAKGKTVGEAMSKLKVRREAATAKLADLGANKDATIQGEPHLVAAANDRQRQIEAMVRERMRQSGKKAPKKADAPLVSVTATLTAEWPLKAGSPEDLLIASQTLTQKIIAADLAGEKEAESVSPEDQEAAEELAQQMGRFGENNQPQPGQPRFVFVSKISKEDQAKALAEAFGKAKAQAAELSHAAGIELGGLHSLMGASAPEASAEDYFANGMEQQDYSWRYRMLQQRALGMADDGPREAVGPEAGPVALPVRVSATFLLK